MISDWDRLVAAGAVVLDGFHAVKHALRFGADLPLVVTADRDRALALAATLAPDLSAVLRDRLFDVDAAELARLTGGARSAGRAQTTGGTRTTAGTRATSDGHHTRMAALAVRPSWPPAVTAQPRTGPLVFLDGPRHAGNYGAVVRVAAGLGASAVVSTGSLDPWHPAVVRGSAGLHFAVPVLRADAVPDGPVLAFDGSGSDARGVAIPDDAVLAFGSERHGLSRTVLDRADTVLSLPMRPGVASYNLATAVAMALYQWSLGTERRDVTRPVPRRGG